MNCCFPFMKNHLIQTCEICYNPCSIFEIKIIDEQLVTCKECYKKHVEARLDPEYKVAITFNEKYKWYSDHDLYSIRGHYVLDKWGLIVGDIKNDTIVMRTFLKECCFLCKGKVAELKDVYINGYLYHYECSKLCILN